MHPGLTAVCLLALFALGWVLADFVPVSVFAAVVIAALMGVIGLALWTRR
jgi:hypothetical protein